MGVCSKGLINEFETAVVNEPSVFEPLKFYCMHLDTYTSINCFERLFKQTENYLNKIQLQAWFSSNFKYQLHFFFISKEVIQNFFFKYFSIKCTSKFLAIQSNQ